MEEVWIVFSVRTNHDDTYGEDTVRETETFRRVYETLVDAKLYVKDAIGSKTPGIMEHTDPWTGEVTYTGKINPHNGIETLARIRKVRVN